MARSRRRSKPIRVRYRGWLDFRRDRRIGVRQLGEPTTYDLD
jgi:hypothetical protein